MKTSNDVPSKLRGKLSSAIRLLPIALWMMTSSGCTHYKVISAERAVLPLRTGESFTAPQDGWFVPDARWQEIRQAIARQIQELENK
ncbi:MAG TPA: hypothetical protein VGE41_10685 [Verrucomicrobiae bacterium]